MSTDDKRVRDCLEQINARVDNWARGGEYGPGGFPKDTAQKDVAFLLAHIADLEDELRAARAFTPRDNAGGTASRGATNGTVAIDAHGCAWARVDPGCWFPLRVDVDSEVIELPESGGPYAIVYTPVYLNSTIRMLEER